MKKKIHIPTKFRKRHPANGGPLNESIPLDLLCDMAWRLVKKEDGRMFERGSWIQCLHQADSLIRDAIRVRAQEEVQADIDEAQYAHMREKILPLLTPEERKFRHVEFERGCKLITGLTDGRKATHKVQAALHRNLFSEAQASVVYERLGFNLDELTSLHTEFPYLPKNALRKPYVKTGRFKSKYQKQKEKILEKSKKVLAGTVGKKRPKRGGISRA